MVIAAHRSGACRAAERLCARVCAQAAHRTGSLSFVGGMPQGGSGGKGNGGGGSQMAGGSKKKLGGSSRTSSWYKVKKTAEAAGAGNERPAAGAHVVIQPRADRRVQVVAAQRRCHRPSHITSQDRGPPTRLAQNENRTGLAQIVDQLYGSNMDFQPKCWAKRCNLGQPCAIFAQGREGRGRACGARRTPGGRGRRAACENATGTPLGL